MPLSQWRGQMSWPLERTWKCEICGNAPFLIADIGYLWTGLEWGITHGVCRCTDCHAQYNMRNAKGNPVAMPILSIKDEYKAAAKVGWSRRLKPLDEWSNEMWATAQQWAQETDAAA